MARPFLADPEFLAKAQEGRVEEINTCIACNQVSCEGKGRNGCVIAILLTHSTRTHHTQACLDHTFKGQRASCLVNPRAGYETELHLPPTTQKKRLAVVRLLSVDKSMCLSMWHDIQAVLMSQQINIFVAGRCGPRGPVLRHGGAGAGPRGDALRRGEGDRGPGTLEWLNPCRWASQSI
jgi:hypothetical protein